MGPDSTYTGGNTLHHTGPDTDTVYWYLHRLPGISEGDVIEVEFDAPTNTPYLPTAIEVHRMLGLSAPLAEAFDMEWIRHDVLQLRLLGRTGPELARALIDRQAGRAPGTGDGSGGLGLGDATKMVVTATGTAFVRPNATDYSRQSPGSDPDGREWLDAMLSSGILPQGENRLLEAYMLGTSGGSSSGTAFLNSTLSLGGGLRREGNTTRESTGGTVVIEGTWGSRDAPEVVRVTAMDSGRGM